MNQETRGGDMMSSEGDNEPIKVEIGDIIETSYGTFEILDIERHHFDPPYGNITIRDVEE